jgi:hypothetical protein
VDRCGLGSVKHGRIRSEHEDDRLFRRRLPAARDQVDLTPTAIAASRRENVDFGAIKPVSSCAKPC